MSSCKTRTNAIQLAKAKSSINLDSIPIPNNLRVPLYYEGQLCHWVRTIFQDSKGDLWIATNHYGVMRYNGDTLEYFSEEHGLGAGRVTDIIEDEKGALWIGTYDGVTKYENNSFTNYPTTDSVIKNDVWSLLIDRKGIFWVGTMNGVFQFHPEKNGSVEENFTHFPIPLADVKDPNTILSPYRVASILEDSKGDIWFATDGYGICKFNASVSGTGDGKAFVHFTKADGLSDNNVADLLEDSRGNIWIGSMYGGISKYNGTSFRNYTEENYINGEEVYGLYESKSGAIWFAAEHHGVYRFTPDSSLIAEGTFENFHEKDGLNTRGIITMFEDKEDRFWFGGWKGLFRFDGKSFTTVTKDGPWD
ncbi:MAG: hypothetical protein HKO56_00705 [Bacteroidia bacterium]|nr:hypothetical protein [Bacteroidia bacterium]NNM15145.1 hypothetical protein [Bacteroidia bacterium]